MSLKANIMAWACTGVDLDTVGPVVRRQELLSKGLARHEEGRDGLRFPSFSRGVLSLYLLYAFALRPQTRPAALYKNFTNPCRLVYSSQLKVWLIFKLGKLSYVNSRRGAVCLWDHWQFARKHWNQFR